MSLRRDFAFRIMVGIALLMALVVISGLVLLHRGAVDTTAWYLVLCQLTAPLGFIAVIAGWTTTEVGRQPWTVYGLLRTADSVTPSLTGLDVLVSLLLYMAVLRARKNSTFSLPTRSSCADTGG